MARSLTHKWLCRAASQGRRVSPTRKLTAEKLEQRALLTTIFVDAAAAAGGDGSPNAPFSSIQDGVDAAAVNVGPDSVVIRSGTYVEQVHIDDPDKLNLRGQNGATVQAPDSLDDVITILSGDVTIRELAVEGGKNGIVATGNTLTLRDVVSRFNEDPDLQDGVEDGHGVVATNMDKVTITGGDYSNNGNEEDQHGITIDTAENVFLQHVTARENGQHGINVNRIGTVMVVGCTCDDNLDGDGIHVDRTTSLTIIGGTYSNNDGDGIDIRRTDFTEVVGAAVNGNGNEGIEVDDSGTVRVVASTFLNNDEDGLDMDDTVEIILIGVLSQGNGFDDPADPGNGFQVEAEDDNDTQSVTVINSAFNGNAADGILIVEEDSIVSRVELRVVTVTGNTESGLDIVITGQLETHVVTSANNGEADNIVTG